MKRGSRVADHLMGRTLLVSLMALAVMVAVTALVAVVPPSAAAASVTVEVTSPSRTDTVNTVTGVYEVLWLDANKADAEGPRGSWISFIVSNPVTETDTLYDLEVTMGPFTDAIGAAGEAALFVYTDDPTREFSQLAPGESVAVYYYVDYAGVRALNVSDYTGYTADYTLSVTASTSPGGTSTSLHSETRHVVTDDLLSAAAAGICQTVELGPGIYIGQQYTMTVGYEYGNNKDIFFMPAGEANFMDHVYRLIDAEITWVNPNEIVNGIAVGNRNRLHYPNAEIKDNDSLPSFEVTYTWEVVSTSTATQVVNPWAAAKSGNKYKYQGFNTGLVTELDVPELPLTVTKSVDPDWMLNPLSTTDYGSGIVHYTVVFTNDAGVSITLSSIEDILPPGVSIEDAIYDTGQVDGVRDWYVTEAKTASSPAVGAVSADTDGDDVPDEPVSWVGVYDAPGGDNQYIVPAALDNDAPGTEGYGVGDDVDGDGVVDEPGTLTLEFLADATQCAYDGETTSYYTNEVYGLYGGAGLTQPEETNHALATFEIGATRTLAVVSDFQAYHGGGKVVVSWETSSEVATAGYYVERFDEDSDKWKRINGNLIASLFESPTGGSYSVVDRSAKVGDTLTYRLVEVELMGTEQVYGPYEVKAEKALPTAKGSATIARGFNEVRIPNLPQTAAPEAATTVNRGQVKKAAGSTMLRIEVMESGLYGVAASDIADGLSISSQEAMRLVKSGAVDLTTLDQKVAYTVAADGSALYFYGQAIDSIYTNSNVYWLTKGNGVLMADDKAKTGRDSSDAMRSFVDQIHFEEDNFAYTSLGSDAEADIWLWDYLVAGNATLQTKTYEVDVPGAVRGIQLQAALYGFTPTKHHAEIALNGTTIGEVEWTGGYGAAEVANLSIPEGLLEAGANEVEVTAHLDGGVPYSVFGLGSFDVAYERTTKTDTGSLLLEAPDTGLLSVEGISAESDVFVMELSDSRSPRVLAWTEDDAGLLFSVQKGRQYLVTDASAVQSPSAMAGVSEPGLTDSRRGAEYVVITSPALTDAAQRFADYRESKGLTTAVVTTSEIYDEFNYGIADPHAIQEFIKVAVTKWKPETEYVLLAGEGSLDYKDHLGYGDCVVPSVMRYSGYSLVASDSALADVLGNDGLSEAAIGRIPALTSSDLDAALAKIKTYEASNGAWRQSVLLAADNPDQGGDFYADSDTIAAEIPSTIQVKKAYLGLMTLAQTRGSVFDAFNEGSLVVNYVGHASLRQLATERLLGQGDVASLRATSGAPLLVALTCQVGDFGTAGYDGLAERLVKKDGGGATAVWAPNVVLMGADSVQLGTLFYEEVFSSTGSVTLGDAIQAAKAAAEKQKLPASVLQAYGLLGDPALQLWW